MYSEQIVQRSAAAKDIMNALLVHVYISNLCCIESVMYILWLACALYDMKRSMPAVQRRL